MRIKKKVNYNHYTETNLRFKQNESYTSGDEERQLNHFWRLDYDGRSGVARGHNQPTPPLSIHRALCSPELCSVCKQFQQTKREREREREKHRINTSRHEKQARETNKTTLLLPVLIHFSYPEKFYPHSGIRVPEIHFNIRS